MRLRGGEWWWRVWEGGEGGPSEGLEGSTSLGSGSLGRFGIDGGPETERLSLGGRVIDTL